MNTINSNNRLNFTAKLQLAEGLGVGNKTLIRACNAFSRQTSQNNRTLHMWEDGGVYKFDFERKNELSPTTQYVGKDVLGYLFMEKGWKGLAEFFESTLKAVEARTKHHTDNLMRDNIKANIDATIIYRKNKAIGDKVKTSFENNFVDYDQAGACLHLN